MNSRRAKRKYSTRLAPHAFAPALAILSGRRVLSDGSTGHLRIESSRYGAPEYVIRTPIIWKIHLTHFRNSMLLKKIKIQHIDCKSLLHRGFLKKRSVREMRNVKWSWNTNSVYYEILIYMWIFLLIDSVEQNLLRNLVISIKRTDKNMRYLFLSSNESYNRFRIFNYSLNYRIYTITRKRVSMVRITLAISFISCLSSLKVLQ